MSIDQAELAQLAQDRLACAAPLEDAAPPASGLAEVLDQFPPVRHAFAYGRRAPDSGESNMGSLKCVRLFPSFLITSLLQRRV